MFQRTFTNTTWEKKVGYCRALKAGDHIYVTGTTSVDSDGHVFAPNDAYLQAKKCLQIIEDTLTKLDVPMSKIARTRMFVTDISKWELFGKAHREFFEKHPPTTTVNSHARLLAPLPT